MIKICVTGNKGFIGRNLQRHLNFKDQVVLGIEKWIFEKTDWQSKLHEYLMVINPDVVFHVGACSDTQNQNVAEMMKMNVESTQIIADWCQLKNVPIIYSSSASVQGTNGEPETLYAWSKYLGEKYVLKCGGIALRYFNVYGEGEDEKGNMSSVAYQAYQKMMKNEKMLLFPQRPTRDFVYINDVVSANIFAWQNYEKLKGCSYDVGTSQTRAFEEVLNTMNIFFEYLPDEVIPKNYQFYTQADPNRFMSGWQPQYPLEIGIKQYLKYLKTDLD